MFTVIAMWYFFISGSGNSHSEIHRDKPKDYWVAMGQGAALEPGGFSPGVWKTEIQEVKCGWWKLTRLLFSEDSSTIYMIWCDLMWYDVIS
jgi:hypothetical protein